MPMGISSARETISTWPEVNMPYTHPDGGRYPRLLDWLRYFCAFHLYMYGISKLLHLQFNMQAELAHRAIGSLTGYQLTWYYYGVSRTYACILGVTQVAGATLLLFRKTTLMGALAMLPVMANILLINIFILVNDYGPYVMSALICASLLTIVWYQRRDLFALLWSTQAGEPERSKRTHWWIRSIVLATVAAIFISGTILQRRAQRLRQEGGPGTPATTRSQ
jgi:hypothetical protein